MEDRAQTIAPDKLSWRAISPWIILPPLLVPIVLILLATGYVLYKDGL